MLSARKAMDVVSVYLDVGSFNAAGEICGVDPKTVKRIVAAHEAGELEEGATRRRRVVAKNTDGVRDLVAKRVADRKARITAKRLLPEARAAGYGGSDRNFRRLVAAEKKAWRTQNGRQRRPAVWVPGETLVIDWGTIPGTGIKVFCAVLAWSRVRFVRFARDETAATTFSLLAECFEELGGVPAKVLADRMGCLKGGTVAGVVIPTPDYVRFATHYGFSPDFCAAADPESKGIVENLVGYAKKDLPMPEDTGLDFASEIDGVMHACGHDVHMSCAMGAAHALLAIKDQLPGHVRIVYQHAEESSPSGGDEMIAFGALEDVDAIIALHCDPERPAGTIGVKDGALTAAYDRFQFKVHGDGGHGARPHQSVDPVYAAVQLIQALYQMAGRHLDARDPVSLSVGTIHGGDAPNVIPDVVTFSGTVRDHSAEHRGVHLLEYEAYEGRVEDAIASIVEEATGKWPILAAVVEHRVGTVELGGPAVVVAVSTAHRDDAFHAARYVIDELKARAPLWKKEHWPGGADWVEGA